MSQSLECPACGARTRVDAVAGAASYTCGRCGRTLKVPQGMAAAATSARGVPRGASAVSSGAGAPPAPRRRARPPAGDDQTSDLKSELQPAARQGSPNGDDAGNGTRAQRRGRTSVSTASGAAGSVTIAAPGAGGAENAVGQGGRSGSGRRRSGGASDRPLPRLVRIAAWVVAVPLAFLVIGLPARKAGYLTKDQLLDVIVKHNIGRFVPLLVISVLWALGTAVLVTLFLEGGRRFVHRRANGDAYAGSDGPG